MRKDHPRSSVGFPACTHFPEPQQYWCPVVSRMAALCGPGASHMRRILLLVAIPLLMPATPVRAEEPLVQKVRKSLDGGINYLKNKQRDEGGRWSWEDSLLSNLQP